MLKLDENDKRLLEAIVAYERKINVNILRRMKASDINLYLEFLNEG